MLLMATYLVPAGTMLVYSVQGVLPGTVTVLVQVKAEVSAVVDEYPTAKYSV
jgi:hypothetical protein